MNRIAVATVLACVALPAAALILAVDSVWAAIISRANALTLGDAA
jgi:hypothetical protein